jgi:hypothetical protein
MIKPTKGDFDRATSQPWTSTTCLVAQLMIRKGLTPNPQAYDPKFSPLCMARANDLRRLMSVFDEAYACDTPDWNMLAKIRASLPRFNWPWQKLVLP